MATEAPREIDASDHDRLVARLIAQLAASLPGATPQVAQTHISTVILAGDFAYKIKRPVRLPFLDFSTLALRQHFCQEELRINRRLAPQLYLDVVPVAGSVDQPVIGGSGAPIDCLLRMRRFASSDEFGALARAGRLRAVHVEALGRYLARFHQGLEPVPPPATGAGAGKEAWQWAAESLDEIAGHPLRPSTCAQEELAALRARLEAVFVRHAGLMARRLAGGFVRECHGDLHLGNIVAWQGEVLAFDAIEFDATLRCIDIINDLAFAFMDLHAFGLPGLAWRLINAWVEQTGDFAGLALLRAYAAGRAVVRAKVALFSGSNGENFSRYWVLAQRLAGAPAAPRMVLTMGLSGSGKSTAAQFLADDLGAVCLRSDVERKRLYGLAPTARPAPALAMYSAQATQRTYARLADLARDLLESGLSVVVDAALLRQDERATLHDLARQMGVAFRLVECVAPPAALQARVAARAVSGTDASDATLEVLDMQQRIREAVPADWAPWHSVLVNDDSLGALQAQTQALVATWNGGSMACPDRN
jgi:aminoglycoside phosphotransferase family enzyme/predicted kinase